MCTLIPRAVSPEVGSTRSAVATAPQLLPSANCRHSATALPPSSTGAREIAAALNMRSDSMRISIDALRTKLGRDVPQYVGRFTPDGAPAGGVTLPTPHITSPAFAGPALDRLFITSAREGLSAEQRAADDGAGDLFVCDPGVTGRPPRTFAG